MAGRGIGHELLTPGGQNQPRLTSNSCICQIYTLRRPRQRFHREMTALVDVVVVYDEEER
jgi:hypothetical protein